MFSLRGPPTQARDAAVAELHSLLLRATRFALSRRQDQLSDLGTAEVDDLAVQAADDALMSTLRTLDDFHGASRFTTWACKFAVHEAGVAARRRSSQARDLLADPSRRPTQASSPGKAGNTSCSSTTK